VSHLLNILHDLVKLVAVDLGAVLCVSAEGVTNLPAGPQHTTLMFNSTLFGRQGNQGLASIRFHGLCTAGS
jgi:hypothetical protein